jgi:hypothetical protein
MVTGGGRRQLTTSGLTRGPSIFSFFILFLFSVLVNALTGGAPRQRFNNFVTI